MHSGLLWTGLNGVIAWESGEFGVEIQLHVVGDGDLAGLLIADGVHIETRAFGSDTVDARSAGGKRSRPLSRGFENSFIPSDENVAVPAIACVWYTDQVRRWIRGIRGKKKEGCKTYQ